MSRVFKREQGEIVKKNKFLKKKTIEQNQNFVTVRAHITAFSQGIKNSANLMIAT